MTPGWPRGSKSGPLHDRLSFHPPIDNPFADNSRVDDIWLETSGTLPLISHIFCRSIRTFLEAKPQNTATAEIAWCPGHENLEGNRKEDKLAKGAGELRATPLSHFYSFKTKIERHRSRGLEEKATVDPREKDLQNLYQRNPWGTRKTRDHIIHFCGRCSDYRNILWNVLDDLGMGEILNERMQVSRTRSSRLFKLRSKGTSVEGGFEVGWEEEDCNGGGR
ncbi:MAG: hypothetical protein NXY57DRAFT_1034800 [Lentinula lateritia]|nr:MAG: hypothetical protein NXY57DRAFT_1034800 [Lentinula lateritia]